MGNLNDEKNYKHTEKVNLLKDTTKEKKIAVFAIPEYANEFTVYAGKEEWIVDMIQNIPHDEPKVISRTILTPDTVLSLMETLDEAWDDWYEEHYANKKSIE